MKKFALALFALATALAITPAAMADTVSYSTNFDLKINPTTTSGSGLNDVVLSFLGVPVNIVDTPTYASLGTFSIVGPFSKTDTFTNVPFDLTITQYIPSSGSAEFQSSIKGVIKMDSSTAVVTFDEPSVEIGNVFYTLTNEKYTLNADSSYGFDPGLTTVEAEITTTPEPSSLLLLGTGLLGLAFVAFRKAKPARPVLNLCL